MTWFIQTCQLCIPTIVEVSLQRFFLCGCHSLLIFVAKKATKGTELQFLCTQGTLQGGRVEDHRKMFTYFTYHNHIFKQYSIYIQNWLYDVFNPLHPNISMQILFSVLYTFPNVLARRICSTIKRFFSWLSFPLFSWP